jgi:hypothetical protein
MQANPAGDVNRIVQVPPGDTNTSISKPASESPIASRRSWYCSASIDVTSSWGPHLIAAATGADKDHATAAATKRCAIVQVMAVTPSGAVAPRRAANDRRSGAPLMCGLVFHGSFPHVELKPFGRIDRMRERNGNIGTFNSP